MRVFSVLVAVLLSVPFLALLFGATGHMISIASNRALDPLVVMWALAIAVMIVSTLGGLRGIAQSGPLQMTMVAVGPMGAGHSLDLGLAAHLVGGGRAAGVVPQLWAEAPSSPFQPSATCPVTSR